MKSRCFQVHGSSLQETLTPRNLEAKGQKELEQADPARGKGGEEQVPKKEWMGKVSLAWG